MWEKPCAYKLVSKKKAFLFSFFLGGLGADWIYLSNGINFGYALVGFLKITIVVLGPFFFVVFVGAGDGNVASLCSGCCLCIVPGLTWYLVDWIRILTGSFYDGLGMELYQDM